MNLYLDAKTSLGFWRLVYPGDRRLRALSSPSITRMVDCAYNEADVQALAPRWLDELQSCGYGKLGVLVNHAGNRRGTGTFRTRVWSSAIPGFSFFRLSEGLYVSSPACVFLQMAHELSVYELIALGDELCGLYSFDPRSPRGIKQREHPLLDIENLSSYLKGVEGCYGFHHAQLAAKRIIENSASPMETVDEMLFCLPSRMGGYGLRVPTMNKEIVLSADAARVAGKRVCKGDLCWPDMRLIVEHQGLYDHADSVSFGRDRARVLALKTDGYDVVELTGNVVFDLEKFEEAAMHVARLQGRRIRKGVRGRLPERQRLRNDLFNWNANNGMARG